MEQFNQTLNPDISYKIGLWGGAESGKTVYLAMLYHVLMDDPTRWEVDASENARRFVEEAYARLFEEKRFIEKTSETADYVYKITDKSTGRQFSLVFKDIPGELADDYSDPQRRGERARVPKSYSEGTETEFTAQGLFDYIKTCEGVLVFLDPRRFEENHQGKYHSYRQTLYQFIEDLRNYRQEMFGEANDEYAPYIALCLTKTDGHDEYWNSPADLPCSSGMLNGAKRGDVCATICKVYAKLSETFMDVRLPSRHPSDRAACFMLSSIGRDKHNQPIVSEAVVWEREPTPQPPFFKGEGRPAKDQLPPEKTFVPKSLSADPRSPKGLLTPLEWILDRLLPSVEIIKDQNDDTIIGTSPSAPFNDVSSVDSMHETDPD